MEDYKKRISEETRIHECSRGAQRRLIGDLAGTLRRVSAWLF